MKFMKIIPFFLVLFCLSVVPSLAAQHVFGLGAGVAPDYEGSDDYEGVPMLMLSGKYDSGRSFALMGTNLRVNLITSDTFQFGPILNYRMERDDVDNDRVDRMRKVDAAFEAGIYALANFNNFLVGVDFLTDISDEHEGSLVQGNVGYKWQHSNDLVITPNLFLTYASSDYMDTYFGVNADNVGNSGLDFYKADSGLKDVGARVVANYTPWDRWGVMGILSISSLLNDAEDSPIVDQEGESTQMFFGVMGTYRFGN